MLGRGTRQTYMVKDGDVIYVPQNSASRWGSVLAGLGAVTRVATDIFQIMVLQQVLEDSRKPINELAPARPVDMLETLRVFWRRKWLLILPWTVATLVGAELAFTLPPVYTSAVTLVFTKPTQLAGKLGDVGSGAVNADAQAELMREQVKSSVFLSGVITATGMRTDRDARAWARKSAGRYGGAPEDEAVVSWWRFVIPSLAYM